MLLEPHAGTIIWTLITFLVVVVILRRTVWGPLLASLDAREQRIRDALEEADRARQEATALLADNRRRMAEADAAAAAVAAEARKAAERIQEEILTRAQAEAQQTLAHVRQSIEQERLAAVADLRREAATLAIEVAGRLLRANLDDERNRHLVDEVIESIPPAPPGSQLAGAGTASSH